jgi:ribonuclease T2
MKISLVSTILFTVIVLFPGAGRSQQAGKFDYYLLSLSWSPEFCYSHRDSPECSEHLGLIVHGLWPQYNGANAGPEHCGNQPGPSNPNSLLDIMPTASLVEHEWSTHGTCSGLNANEYFGLMRRVFSNFRVPPQLQHPYRQVIYRTSDLKQAIAQSNQGLNQSEIALSCRGQYLSEVELCVTKDGRPQPCVGLRECRGSRVFVSAVR